MSDLLAAIGNLPESLQEPTRAAALSVLHERVSELTGESTSQAASGDARDALTSRHFEVIAASASIQGINGKGAVYAIQPGEKVYLKSKHDRWAPNDQEPFNDQVRRVFFDPDYANFREQERMRIAVISMSSPLYLDRAMKSGLATYLRTFSGGVA